MSHVAVTGAAGPVGRRVVRRLLDDPAVDRVVAIDRESMVSLDLPDGPALELHQGPLLDSDLEMLFGGVGTVCHLAGSDPLEDTAADHDVRTTSRVLEAAAAAGARQVIVRTSATVYGAWPDNPVPLSESAPLRPNRESWRVLERAAVEDRVRAFADDHPEMAVAVLRPCVTVSSDGPDELGRVLAASRLVASTDGAPASQFVHADDVAAAVDLVRREGADGVFNVAPDGALDPDLVRALVGGAPRFPLPEAIARRLSAFGWRYQLAPTPPGFLPFVNHPWVVANDRLQALGWKPEHTNEEAFVAGHDAAPWATISPQRRQELALGATALALAAGLGGAVYAVRRKLG